VNGAAEAVQSAPIEGRLMAGESRLQSKRPSSDKRRSATEGSANEHGAPNKLASYPIRHGLRSAKAAVETVQRCSRTWSLAQGKLQRSLDAGATWLIALQLEHPLLSFGRERDVGLAVRPGRSFIRSIVVRHGAWCRRPRNPNRSTPILSRSNPEPVEIVLSTSNNEFWTTVDAGKTWEKK